MQPFMKSRTIKYTTVIVLTISLIIAAVPSLVCAYTLSGYSWDDVTPLKYKKDSGMSAASSTAWSSSVSDWQPSDANFQLDSSNYEVYLSDTYNSGIGWDGITVLTTSGTTILSASAYLNTYYTSSYAVTQRRSVSGHELGHVLGLDEHSGWVLMEPSTYNRWHLYYIYTPTQDDFNGVNSMY